LCDDNLPQSDLPKDTGILRTAAQHNRGFPQGGASPHLARVAVGKR
jgi:hypothetical protein